MKLSNAITVVTAVGTTLFSSNAVATNSNNDPTELGMVLPIVAGRIVEVGKVLRGSNFNSAPPTELELLQKEISDFKQDFQELCSAEISKVKRDLQELHSAEISEVKRDLQELMSAMTVSGSTTDPMNQLEILGDEMTVLNRTVSQILNHEGSEFAPRELKEMVRARIGTPGIEKPEVRGTANTASLSSGDWCYCAGYAVAVPTNPNWTHDLWGNSDTNFNNHCDNCPDGVGREKSSRADFFSFITEDGFAITNFFLKCA